MAYTAATVIPTNIKIFQWARPDHPNPRLVAPIRSDEDSAKFSSMPKDYAGNDITGSFFMGVRRASDGLVTNFFVPAAAINATTYVATGLIRIRTNGLDYTTDDDINDPIDHNADDQIFCNYAPVFEQMLYSVWTGALGLSPSSIPYYASAPTFTPGSQQLCTVAYADALAIAGSPNITTSTKGIGELATQAEVDARTATGSTLANLLINPANLRAVKYHDYAATSTGNDTYVIAPTPSVTAYATGQVFNFIADVGNTGACSLNVSGLGAKSLKVFGADPVTGYIGAGSVVMCEYDGTNMQILSVGNLTSISQSGIELYGGTSGAGTDTYAVNISPAVSAYTTGQKLSFKADVQNTGAATINYNGVGALTLKKWTSAGKQDLADGDIAANQIVSTQYDGTDAVVTSPLANFTGRVATSTTPVDTHSTTGEQTILSVSVPANTLKSANAVRGVLYVSDFDLANGATIILRLKYGATTVATMTLAEGGSTNLDNYGGKIEIMLRGAGTTSSQRGDLYSSLGTVTSAAAASDLNPLIFETTGTASEDSTGALNMVVTAEMSSSSAAIGLVTTGYLIEKIQ